MKNTQPYLPTSEPPEISHSAPPLTQVRTGSFWEWMRRCQCRRAKTRSRIGKLPDIYDQWGCPYWLNIDRNGDSESWFLFGGAKMTRIGKVIISWDDNHTIILRDIIIESRQDRGHGLGSILLKRVIQYAKEQGVIRIVAELVPEYEVNRPQLVKWYESFGFKVEIRQKLDKEFMHCVELNL